jgi:hypothetical protein
MPRAKALKVKVADRPGLLGEIASALGAKGINVRAVNGYAEAGQGVVCLVVDKLPPRARSWRRAACVPREEILELSSPRAGRLDVARCWARRA